MRLTHIFSATALLACYTGNAYAEMDGVGFLIVFLVIGIIFLGYPLLSFAIGLFIQDKLITKGYSQITSIVVGIAITLIIFLIPALDYPYKKMLINEYCEKEGGLHISKTVTNVEGVFQLPYSPSYGYRYFEDYVNAADKTGLHRVYRKENSPTGQYIDEKVDTPSPYGFKMTRSHASSSIYRVVLQTYVTATGEELGRYVYFESYAGTDSNVSTFNGLRYWMRMSCPTPKTNNGSTGYYRYLPELLQSTLQPTNSATIVK